MPIHYRSLTRKYAATRMATMQYRVKDAEFMLESFRRDQISWELFYDYASIYTSTAGRGMVFKTVKEIDADDPELCQEAEELVNRNERILEQLKAAIEAVMALSEKKECTPGEVETLIQAEVYRRTEDPDQRVYYPLPALN